MPTIRINESRSAPGQSASVTVVAEPLTIGWDDNQIGAEPSAAIAKGIADAIRNISQTSRNGKHAAFNNSGRLVRELVAIAAVGGYDIVAPPGYLQSDEVFQKLIDLVPAIQDPTTLIGLAEALERALTAMVKVG